MRARNPLACKTIIIALISCSAILSQERNLPADSLFTTENSVILNGNSANHTARTGTQAVWYGSGKPIAFLHYTYSPTPLENKLLVMPIHVVSKRPAAKGKTILWTECYNKTCHG